MTIMARKWHSNLLFLQGSFMWYNDDFSRSQVKLKRHYMRDLLDIFISDIEHFIMVTTRNYVKIMA